MSSRAEIDEVSKEIIGYETVTGAKINCSRSVGWQLGMWRGVSPLNGQAGQDTPCLVGSGSPLKNELIGGIGESQCHSLSVVPEESFFKGGGMGFCTSRFHTILMSLTRVLFSSLRGGKASKICLEICYPHSSEGGLSMQSIEIHLYMLCIVHN